MGAHRPLTHTLAFPSQANNAWLGWHCAFSTRLFNPWRGHTSCKLWLPRMRVPVGIGGWAITSSQVVWFAETWNMQDIRAVWPCLVKPAQRYIACFETLAQLALLQATHSHIGGGHYSFRMPSGTDNSSTEASLNKLFTTSWPLQLFVQLTGFWAHAHNVLLQPTHVPGRCNDWADDLSRGRLARFRHRPESRIRFSPAGLAMSGRGIQLCPMHAPWRPEHVVLNCLASLICILTCLATTWPSSPCQPEQLAAPASRLHRAALTRKSAGPE